MQCLVVAVDSDVVTSAPPGCVCVCQQDRYTRSGYVLEWTWHVIMGDPWIQPKHDIKKLCSKAPSEEEILKVCDSGTWSMRR